MGRPTVPRKLQSPAATEKPRAKLSHDQVGFDLLTKIDIFRKTAPSEVLIHMATVFGIANTIKIHGLEKNNQDTRRLAS